MLISAIELAQHPDAVICDVRFYLDDHDQGRREYDEVHLPGARFVDLHHQLADLSITGKGRHPLPDPAAFAALLGGLGIGPDDEVVVYDSVGGAFASRMWWMLRSIGHHNVAVLDGGYQAWVAADLPVTGDVPAPLDEPTPYPIVGGWTNTVEADDVNTGSALIDSRSADRYRGEVESIDPRAGHIPGAINISQADTIGPDGLHRPIEELRALYADVGTEPVVYCGSGVTACHNLLALSLVGIDDAKLFPGSWSQWSNDPTRPVETA